MYTSNEVFSSFRQPGPRFHGRGEGGGGDGAGVDSQELTAAHKQFHARGSSFGAVTLVERIVIVSM